MLLTIIKNACGNALGLCRKEAAAPRRRCFTFALNGTRFGIDTRIVKGVTRYRMLAEVHGKPPFMRGQFSHQGRSIPVLDLAAIYGTCPLEPGKRTCVIIVELGFGKWQLDIGIMVDEILGLVEFEPDELKQLPEIVYRLLNMGIVEGMLKQEKDFLIVIDAWRLLTETQMEELIGFMRR
jgi:purine-binding chemotaxis protein CheW